MVLSTVYPQLTWYQNGWVWLVQPAVGSHCLVVENLVRVVRIMARLRLDQIDSNRHLSEWLSQWLSEKQMDFLFSFFCFVLVFLDIAK